MLFLFIWIFVGVCLWLFNKYWLPCMIVTRFLSHIQFIYWFFTCIDLYIYFSILIFLVSMFVAVWQEVIYFVWSWHDYYLISSSLIDSLFAYFCILFLAICIILVSMWVAVFTRSDYIQWLWYDYYRISSSVIDSVRA